MAGEITTDLLDQLSVRLEDNDAENPIFEEKDRLNWLIKAQIYVATMLHQNYLTEFEETEEAVAVADQAVAFSALNDGNGVIQGKEGIVNVKVYPGGTGGKWSIEIDAKDLKNTENSLMGYSDTRIKHYIWNEKVHVLCDTYAATTADVYFLAVPADIARGVDPVLNKAHHEILLDVAESYAWRIDRKMDRADKALTNAHNQIKILNDKVTPAQGTGKKVRS